MSKSAWNCIEIQLKKVFSELPHEVLNQNWVIAVSGGLDSMALLRAVFQEHQNCLVAHINYKKRGLESDLDEELVKKTCAELNIPFQTCVAPSFDSGNFQEEARKFRYQFFEEIGKKFKAPVLVLGHHKNDSNENLLFRTLRGSYANAILGAPVWDSWKFRPFLALTKEELQLGMVEKGFTWREDKSNSENDFNRNWLRNSCIPEFDSRFPDWDKHLSEKAQLELDLLNLVSNQIKDDLVWHDSVLELQLSLFKSYSKRIILAICHQKLAERSVYVSNSALEKAMNLSEQQKGNRMDLKGNIIAIREEQSIVFLIKSELENLISISVNEKGDWEEIKLKAYTASLQNKVEKQKGIISLDADCVKFPLKIRNWQNGDRMQPLGMQGTKLVSDIITLAKTPNYIKDEILVISGFDDVIHAIIFPQNFCQHNRISENSKIKNESQTVLQLKPN